VWWTSLSYIGTDVQRSRSHAPRSYSRPTSTSRSRRFKWTTILDTRALIAEDLRAAPGTPGAHADGVLHQKERSQPTPVAEAGAATDI
jgi:hypothetical protein